MSASKKFWGEHGKVFFDTRQLIKLGIIWFALFLLGFSLGYRKAFGHEGIYEAEVLRVIDGDTIDAKVKLGLGVFVERRLRFFGVDAPETRTLDKDEKRRGNLVKRKLRRIIGEAEKITIHDKGTGKFGRRLAVVYIEGRKRSLNWYVKKWSKQ